MISCTVGVLVRQWPVGLCLEISGHTLPRCEVEVRTGNDCRPIKIYRLVIDRSVCTFEESVSAQEIRALSSWVQVKVSR